MQGRLEDKVQFKIELLLALAVAGIAAALGFSNLLFASNDLYPGATDFLGHMAKIEYIADSLKQGILPSWYPYWYCGTAVTQYYPPLSYYIMAPIFILTNNVMITYKIFCFVMLSSGSMGVWYFCRYFIGRWCGLPGIVFFCFQPYILQTLFGQGQVAQGPIIAFASWYLVVLLKFGQNPTAVRFTISVLLCALMILSHPNSIFMYCICIMLSLTVLLCFKKISLLNYGLIAVSIVFAGALTAFWSLVGVTGLENPTLPYVLGEAVSVFSATKEWFIDSSFFFYFSILSLVGSIIASMLYLFRVIRKFIKEDENYYTAFSILLTAITVIFSFGLKIPFFKYLPMAESIVAGRILCLTSSSAAILCSYLLYRIKSIKKAKRWSLRLLTILTCLIIIIAIVIDMNPLRTEYSVKDGKDYARLFSSLLERVLNFENGRYIFIGPFDSGMTYFPIKYGFNLGEGFNIEGTLHNRFIWDEVVANRSGNYNYIAKTLASWNVRYVFLFDAYNKVSDAMNEIYDFKIKDDSSGSGFYISNSPSSYFLLDLRNALILGPGAPGVAMEFPYLVYDQRKNIIDYSLEELSGFKLVYLCEPSVNTVAEREKTENRIKELLSKGIIIIIEPSGESSDSLFGVSVSNFPKENSPVMIRQKASKIGNTADEISSSKTIEYNRILFGLDEVYYKLIQNEGRLENDIIGVKRVGNGEVLFIGMHLSQYLKAAYVRNWGAPENEFGYPRNAGEVKAFFEELFTYYNVTKNFWPEPFPVINAVWDHKGVVFDYFSNKPEEMTVSLTYAPRWKAEVDGSPLEVGQRENLITLKLPAGEHKVKLTYGITIYGMVGYIISLATLFALLLFIRFYDKIFKYYTKKCAELGRYLHF